MPLSLSKDELIRVVGGKTSERPFKGSFTGVEFNSGEVRGGELFVAIKGATTHGHQFLNEAFSKGAAMALVEDEALLSAHPEADRLVCVSDTLVAFQRLANWWRRELKVPVVAVTGSVGKTTCKEIMAAILLQRSRGVYSVKSHNNHTGVPYTILKAGREHEWLVLEMGMNHPGELSVLSKIGEPDVCGITCIAPSHIGNLGSLEAIRSAKLEILSALSSQGIFFTNADDTFLASGVAVQRFADGQRVRSFGTNQAADVRLTSVESHGLEGITVALSLRGPGGATEEISAKMDLIGRHNGLNVAAAVLGVRSLFPDFPIELIQRGLTSFRAPLMRLNLKTIPDGRMVLDDSYNAGPNSMCALLELGADLQSQGKMVGCVLGEMRELGEFSERYHREVGQYLATMRPAFVVGVGEAAKFYLEAAKAAGIPATLAENPEVAAHIAQKLRFDILVVKGSRGVGLDRTVKTLEKR